MLDIIIPCYNSEANIYKTLFSLGTVNYGWRVWLIDDCSTDKIDYLTIKNFFNQFYPVEDIHSPCNVGPGGIRQIGIEITNGDYIMFIDCGDQVILPQLIAKYITVLDEQPDIWMISPMHLEEYRDNHEFGKVDAINNRIHGKIYRRSFLTEYGIKFNVECPRANEDIGFNYQCRFVIAATDLNHVLYVQDPLVLWTHDPTSIVRSNNYEFMFSSQNIGLAINAHHAIENIKHNLNPPIEIFLFTIYDIFGFMYINYLNVCTAAPEYKEISLKGAKYFYDLYKDTFLINEDLFKETIARNYMEAISTADYCAYSLNNINLEEFIALLEDINE